MITIEAKRWFQKTYGNTYHSVSVYKDGELIGRVAFRYGYGESYLQSAHQILADNGLFDWERTSELVPVCKGGKVDYHTPKESINHNEAYRKFMQDMVDNRANYLVLVNDVTRRRDL